MRPVLEAVGERLQEPSPPAVARVSLHRRLLVTVPMVTWGAGVVVAGLITPATRELDTIGQAGVVAFAVSAAISMWLGLVLADAVSGPITDLRDATRKVGAGDLSVRVPVVSTDETGELAASFNAMVAGLGERRQLHEAFGAFVDPALTERVLAEGTDLRGEEIERLDPVRRRARVHRVRRDRRPARGRRGAQRALRGGGAGDPPARRACQQVHRRRPAGRVRRPRARQPSTRRARSRRRARSPGSPARARPAGSGSGWA